MKLLLAQGTAYLILLEDLRVLLLIFLISCPNSSRVPIPLLATRNLLGILGHHRQISLVILSLIRHILYLVVSSILLLNLIHFFKYLNYNLELLK